MSSGLAVPTVTDVMPDVAFPSPGDVSQGVPHPMHAADQLGGHVLHGALHGAHQLVDPLVAALGPLSGALLAGRAVMAGAQLLAEAAIRAGQAQDELRTQQLAARQAAGCWRDAAYAAARLNARIETLAVHVRRAAAEDPDAPPGPGIPPVIDPVGMTLEEVGRRLVETDGLLRRAEEQYARSVLAAVCRPWVTGSTPNAAWHAQLRARRSHELMAYGQAPTEAAATAHRTQPVAAPRARTADEVLRQGADLLAALPLQLSAEDYRTIEEKIAAAADVVATRPAAARSTLKEAQEAARQLWAKAAQQEDSARQLAFLRADPEGAPLPDAAAEIAALEAFLHENQPLTEENRRAVEARVRERTDALQRVYTAQTVGAALWAAEAAGVAQYTAGDGTRITDWRPPGWDAGHWLRISLDPAGTVRVSTQHRPRTPGEDTREALHLDWQRCTEAVEYLRDIRRVAGLTGLDLPFVFEEPPALPPAPPAVPWHVKEHPKVRHHQEPSS